MQDVDPVQGVHTKRILLKSRFRLVYHSSCRLQSVGKATANKISLTLFRKIGFAVSLSLRPENDFPTKFPFHVRKARNRYSLASTESVNSTIYWGIFSKMQGFLWVPIGSAVCYRPSLCAYPTKSRREIFWALSGFVFGEHLCEYHRRDKSGPEVYESEMQSSLQFLKCCA